jgi:1-acyl-sn-glycerol-3-phosphate acyltransferase
MKKKYYAMNKPYYTRKRMNIIFKFIALIARLFFVKKHELRFKEQIDFSTPSIYIANHATVATPTAIHLYFPGKKRPWVIGAMCSMKTIPEYASKEFWTNLKPAWWYRKILPVVLSPIGYIIMRGAEAIPVYRDNRMIVTIKKTVQSLEEGVNVYIFPEYDAPYSEYHNDFEDGFVNVASVYYRKTKKKLKFYPLYNCLDKKIMSFGMPVEYNPENPIEEERKRITNYLKENITALAKEIGPHKVISYRYKGNKR